MSWSAIWKRAPSAEASWSASGKPTSSSKTWPPASRRRSSQGLCAGAGDGLDPVPPRKQAEALGPGGRRAAGRCGLGYRALSGDAGGSSTGVPLTATALAPEASGKVRGERAGENIRIELDVRGLPELREDEYYEMWYAREDGERISCGAFRPGG